MNDFFNDSYDKTIYDKTQFLSNYDNYIPDNYIPANYPNFTLLNISKFKDYEVVNQLDLFSNFSDFFLIKKSDSQDYYFLKLYRKGMILDEFVLNKIKLIKSEVIAEIIDYGFDINLQRFFIIEKFYNHGSLSNFIKNNYELIKNNYKLIDSIISQINEGIYLLHKNEILHKDIKSSNILIKEIIKNKHGDIEDIKVVISDFNISSMIPTEVSKKITNNLKGTIVYMAPESFSKVLTKKSDYWSLGIILYELLFNRLPFENLEYHLVLYKLLTEEIEIQDDINLKYILLLKGLLNKNIEKRFYYEQVRNIVNIYDELKIKQIYEQYFSNEYFSIYQNKAKNVIIYNEKEYKDIEDLIKQNQVDEKLFYSLLELLETSKYIKIFNKEDIKIIENFKTKMNNLELVLSLYTSLKKRFFYLYNIKINQKSLLEIIKKYFDKRDSLSVSELKIIKLIWNCYTKNNDIENFINIYLLYQIETNDNNLNNLITSMEKIKKIDFISINKDIIFALLITLLSVNIYELKIYQVIDKTCSMEEIVKEVLDVLLSNKIFEICKYWIISLLENSYDYVLKLFYSLFDKYIQEGDIDKIQFLASIINNLNKDLLLALFLEKYENDNTLIHKVVKSKVNEQKIMKILLEYGANPNLKDVSGQTPLHLAIVDDKIEIVKLLLEYLVDYNLKDNLGNTPLILAIKKNRIEIVELLLQYGADVNLKDDEGRSPLYLAIMDNNIRIVELLLRYGANPNLKDDLGDTLLHIAVQQNNLEIIKLLIGYGADPNLKNIFGITPLGLASKKGHKKIAWFLRFKKIIKFFKNFIKK
jgi:ankyrin repeat protein/serine/threonine protein kinase